MKIVDLVNDDPEKRLQPYERMATAIVEIIKEKGACLPQDLNAKGFTPRKSPTCGPWPRRWRH